MGTKLSFFIHYPKMMLGFSSNSAERRQKCTTTIRSCRAHPRRVLDTAALNAYVPDYVGSKSKSRSELTWNHVVSVFTFFGLLMTALMSLCCWSHFQFIVERRRLAPKDKVTVTNSPELALNLTYELTDKDADVPKWFEAKLMNTSEYLEFGDQIHIFGGSNEIKDSSWKAHAKQWYISIKEGKKDTTENAKVIFFDQVQKKWHMGGKEGLMYRSPSTNPEEVPSGTEDEFCKKCGTPKEDCQDKEKCTKCGGGCSNKLHNTEKLCKDDKESGCTWAKWVKFQWYSKAGRGPCAKGAKPDFAKGKKDATKPIRVS